ncbi:MAG TPA: FAD-dependent monooxygenase [Puia sp.]|nr:FAD-dependent monooxygenase [Puia sp.]
MDQPIESYDIIISGAGPTGLMLACQLARQGANFLILDKKTGITNESRALVVQARSMEIYQQMGLSEEVEREGEKSLGINFYRNGKRSGAVVLGNLGEGLSPFPYVMVYEQNKNESLLYRDLQSKGKEVKWDSEITFMEENNSGYSITIKQSTEGEKKYACKYLVACDGSKSRVREFSGMPFQGGSYENVFYVADTHVKANIAPYMLSFFLTKESLCMFFPMQGKDRFRVLGILPKEYYHRDNIHFEEVEKNTKAQVKMQIQFYDTQWYSTYKLHHKKVIHFNQGNIFFAGDAAHVHSPAGGQGMNTGLQDAYNLAWKLSLVSKGHAGNALLNSYHEERNPIAEDLLKSTDRLFGYMIKGEFFYAFVRQFLLPLALPLVARYASLRKQLFLLVSQTAIHYMRSSLSKGKAGSIRAGRRFPPIILFENAEEISAYDLIKRESKTPFLIIVYKLPAGEFLEIDKDLFRIIEIPVNSANEQTLKGAGFPESFFAMVRPDNYIGYISKKPEMNEFNQFMKTSYHLNGK